MRSLQLEDAILAAWNVAGVPLLASSSAAAFLTLGDQPDMTAGIVQLLAVLGVIVAIATRPATPSRGTPAPRMSLPISLFLMGPLIGAVAFVAGSASTHLGLALDGPIIGAAFLALVAAMAFADRLPVIDAGLRRALVLPFILIAAGLFDLFAADLLSGLDLADLTDPTAAQYGGLVIFFGLLLLGGLAAFYAALVAAPRTLVEPSLSGWWPLRFAVFVASAVLGIGWLSALSA